MNVKNLLITVLLTLIGSYHPIYGQGWIKNYGRGQTDQFSDLIMTENNKYFALGYSENPDTGNEELFLLKIDDDGIEIWRRYYGPPTDNMRGTRLSSTADGGFIIAGYSSNINTGEREVYLLKTDENGIKEWSNSFDYGGNTWAPSEILQTEDGGYLLGNNQTNGDVWYGKFSSLGIVEWNYIIASGPGSNRLPTNIEIMFDGYLISGENKLIKLDLLGQEVWVETIENNYKIANMIPLSDGNFMLLTTTSFEYRLSKRNSVGNEISNVLIIDSPYRRNIEQMVETDDGGIILVEPQNTFTTPIAHFTSLLKVNNLGEEEWYRDVGPIGLYSYSLIKNNSGALVFAGTNVYNDSGSLPKDGFLMKTDQEGNLYSNYITGTVFIDNNLNCIFEEGTENGFAKRLVQAIGNQTFYRTTDEMGNYTINVDTGSYQVSVITPSPYWETCDLQIITISEFYTDTIANLAIQPIINCPWLTVDISTPFLRRCFENNYTVHYCNDGTTSAEDAYVEVEFDPFLEVQSSSLPWTTQVGNTYTFDVGTLDPGDCGSFNVRTLVNCDSTILGQTHCTQAHIFPDSLCLPDAADWDGSSIAVEAECDGDSVRFTIRNIGDGNMLEVLNYIIIEDEIMVHQGDFQLNAGQSQMLPDGYSNSGATYRIIAEQANGHPGNSIPTAAIEGCGTTIFPFGFFNMFSQNDGDFYLSIDCQENIGSYDPNDKQAFPTGYGDEHFIWQNVDLEYLIRFQNTGTDTAFTVVIRDTISEHLDITTLQMGASSHNYTYTIDGEGVLKVRFDNILLPDSTTNQLGSNGFFKYKIKQEPDNPIGTMIYNKAAIYFDFNAPIITNETYHEVGEPFLETTVFTNDLTTNNIKLHVFPNPFGEFTSFEIENLPAGKTDFLLYDNFGRLVRKEAVLDGAEFQFHRKGLSAGLYFYEFRQAGARITSGKMLAK